MIYEQFHALLTFDKNLRYQQNFDKYSVSVFVYNTYAYTYKVFCPYLTKSYFF
jgi:hypothetical protein